MQPVKETIRNGSISRVLPQRDLEAFRAELDRRYTTPFVFNPWRRVSQNNEPPPATKWFKRIVIMVLGGTVFAVGVAMIVLPGPAVIVIPAGLAILAVEFAWARRWLRSVRAILPRRHDGRPMQQKVTLQSLRHSLGFLFRRVRRTVQPK